MTQSASPPVQGWSARRRLFVGAVGAFIILTIVYFGAGVRTQLQGLATANSDSIQWNMSQAEVEYLALLVAVKGAAAQSEADLNEVRTRFDVLSSRISTLEAGALYADLRQLPDAASNIGRVRAFLDRNVVFIDADDWTLDANLPAITSDAQATRTAIRNLALQGISHFSEQKDQSRADISNTLLSIAVLSTVLFALLWGDERVADARQREQQTDDENDVDCGVGGRS